MNGTIYTIIRTGVKQKNGHVKVLVEFFTDTENLNGEERSDTNKSIRRYLGTYDDFILTAFSLQADNNNFIEKSQRERKDLLSQFLDITVFEQLYQLASDEIKETAGKLKAYKKTDFDIIINDADTVITNNQQDITLLETREDELQEQRNTAQNEIVDLIQTKQPTSYNGPNIDDLVKSETALTKNIMQLQTATEKAEINLDILLAEYLVIKKDKRVYDETELQNKLEVLEIIESDLTELDSSIKKQQGIINAKQEKITHLSDHEYDPKCEYCTSNVFVQDAIEAQNTIEADRNVLTNLLQRQQAQINAVAVYSDVRSDIDSLTKLKQSHETKRLAIEKLELQIQIMENELQTRESELETCLERQESFKANETAITHNEIIDTQIAKLKTNIDAATVKIKTITETIRSKHGAIEVAKTTKKSAIESLDTYKQLETEYKAFEYYLDSVKRDGVPYELIAMAMPKIESEINNVLNQVVDFNMVLQSDGKNINGYIIYDDENFWPLELTSGMERFISSLAIRIALINVSALPRPNFIAIDEGWGSLDAEHIASVVNLFDYFRTKFDFSIIISHVDTMRDMVDNLIEVNKIDKFSQICHT
jgi:DNA repair exonuclease SbcCD ATPase subunit